MVTTITAVTAEKMVMPRAVRGFCPWATAKVVITPAPRQATANWLVRSLDRFTPHFAGLWRSYGAWKGFSGI